MTSTSSTPTALDAAITFTSNICFHRSLYLAATPSHPKLRVTYATTTNFESELPVVLFCHPMGAARYLIFGFEEMAKKEGVRVVIVDRPGFGGSSAVALENRVQMWLESVSAVLEKLNVKHVALLSHSAGTIYAFNFAVKLSHLMYPGKAFMACLAPWVHPNISSAPLMQVVDKLPASWIGNLHHIHSFVGNYIAPSLTFSSAKLGVQPHLTEEESQRFYGVGAQTWDAMGNLQQKWQGKEDLSGISVDSTLCIQRDGKDWGVYSSLPAAITALRDTYAPSGNSGVDNSSTLVFKAYFAESDVMIGRGGREYFEKCWREGNVDGDGQVRFEAKVVEGADHDSIVLPEKGVIGEVFREIKRVCG